MSALDELRKIEWSGTRQGQGSGPMGSGGDGPHVEACPRCGGIKPTSRWRFEFGEEAWGHQSGCSPASALLETTDAP